MKYVTFKYWCLSDFHDTAWYLRARNTHGYPDIMHGLHPTLSWLNNCLIPFLNFFSLQLLLCIVVCVCVAGAGEGGGWPCSMQNFPDKGLNPCRLQWKHTVLTTGLSRVSILTASYSFSYDSVFHVLGGGGDIQSDGEGRVWSLSVWFYILTLPHNRGQACLFISHRVGVGGKWELVYIILLLIWPSAFSLDSYHTCPVDLLISSRPVWSCPSLGHFPSINHISCCYCLVNKLCSIFLQPHGL